MALWDEITKAFDKVEETAGVATKVMQAVDPRFQPSGSGHVRETVPLIAPAPSAYEGQAFESKSVGQWWNELPAPAKIGAYSVGGLLVLGIAWKLFK